MSCCFETRRLRTERWWAILRRALVVLAAATALVSLSAIAIGPWRFSPFGVRLFSVSNPIKPLTFSLLLGIGLALTSPRLRHAYSTRSVLGFYCVGRASHVAVQPRAGALADGEAVHVSRSVRAADVFSGIQRAARAGAVLDDDDLMSGGHRRHHVRSPDSPNRSRSGSPRR